MAEGVGFEPTLRFPVNTLSKRAPSATRPPLRTCGTRRAHASLNSKTRAAGALVRLQLRGYPSTTSGAVAAHLRLRPRRAHYSRRDWRDKALSHIKFWRYVSRPWWVAPARLRGSLQCGFGTCNDRRNPRRHAKGPPFDAGSSILAALSSHAGPRPRGWARAPHGRWRQGADLDRRRHHSGSGLGAVAAGLHRHRPQRQRRSGAIRAVRPASDP